LSDLLGTIGSPVKDIPVEISYRIIDLFSGHLYSSPSKAIEELVANSYDAFAKECVVSVPEIIDEKSLIWVWDDGESMDVQGLEELWLVAGTHKRDPDRQEIAEKRGRLPIGKFGIGKLASYVLGRRITHLTKKNGAYLAVTMDYGKIIKEDGNKFSRVSLAVRRLTRDEVSQVIPFVLEYKHEGETLGKREKDTDSWTVVVVDQLKQGLPVGRLRWILATALPLRPDFRLWLNEYEVKSSKEKIPLLKHWTIGKKDEDTAAKKLEYTTGNDSSKKSPFDFFVSIPTYGNISGTVDLYKSSLDVGKAEETGTSHGFFVMVGGRLINMDDNHFGITSIPHLAFNKFRAVVYAEFLDNYLTASREDITDIGPKNALQIYLKAVFNEVRNAWDDYQDKLSKKASVEDHLKNVPNNLLSFPLRQAIERIVAQEYSGVMIRVEPERETIASIETIETRLLDPGEPIATLTNGALVINANHPFLHDYTDSAGVQRLAIAELLLEAYLADAGLEPAQISEVLARRDELLRTLASKFPESALAVAQYLRESVASQNELEIACVDAFRAFGFESTRLGGPNRPDGYAIAHLGIDPVERKLRKYTVTIDAKSTQGDAVQAGNVEPATVARHKKEYHAQHAVVIGVDFQGGDADDSKVAKESKDLQICLIKANDFADLLVTSTTKPLSLERLRDLFSLNTPLETTAWVQALKDEKPTMPSLVRVLRTIYEMQKKDLKAVPTITAVRYEDKSLQEFSDNQIREWLLAIHRLKPDLLYVTDDKVLLNQTPDYIVQQVREALGTIPPQVNVEPMLISVADSVSNQ
jgi:hypothetical protein